MDDVDDLGLLVLGALLLLLGGGIGTGVCVPLVSCRGRGREIGDCAPKVSPPMLILRQSASYATPSMSLMSYESEMISSSVMRSCGRVSRAQSRVYRGLEAWLRCARERRGMRAGAAGREGAHLVDDHGVGCVCV